MTGKRYPRYQDYVIKDGKLVAEFDQMYRDYDDPWEQLAGETWASDKALGLNWLARLAAERGMRRVVEIGCGLGAYSARIGALGVDVLGTDISETAVRKAKAVVTTPGVRFEAGSILDFHIYHDFGPQAFVLADISWYVLKELPAFLSFLHAECQGAYIVHLLTTYPVGEQRYGADVFSTHEEIVGYFGLDVVESAVISRPEKGANGKSAFLARVPNDSD